jgi:hypothetical protein
MVRGVWVESIRLIADVQIRAPEFLRTEPDWVPTASRSIFNDRVIQFVLLDRCVATPIVIPEELIVTLAARER